MGYVALARLRWGDGFIEPGEPVPDPACEPGRNYRLMEECGQIEQVAEPVPAKPSEPDPEHDPAPAPKRARTRKKATP